MPRINTTKAQLSRASQVLYRQRNVFVSSAITDLARIPVIVSSQAIESYDVVIIDAGAASLPIIR